MELRETGFELIEGKYQEVTHRWHQFPGLIKNYYRLYIPVDGGAWIYTSDKKIRLQMGYCYFIPGFQPIGFSSIRFFNMHWLHFRPVSPVLNAMMGVRSRVTKWKLEELSPWNGVLSNFESHFVAGDMGAYLNIQSLLLHLVSDVIHESKGRGVDTHSSDLQRLRPALELMDNAYLNPPSLEEIAKTVGLHPVYFQQIFKKNLGCSPHEYLLRMRMSLASKLLVGTSMSIAQIADELNYDNPFYFSTVYKKFYGESPKMARKHPDTYES